MKNNLEIPKSELNPKKKQKENPQINLAHNFFYSQAGDGSYDYFGEELQSSEVVPTGDLFHPLGDVPQFKGNNESRNNKLVGNYVISTMNTLPELITETRKSSIKNVITLRFLLTPKFELLFAKEGVPTGIIPAHFCMTGEIQNAALCITAGNIKIDQDDKIIHITHKSGDFHPSWESLQYALFALLACGAQFSNTFTIEKHIKTFVKLTVQLEDLQNELNAKFSDTLKKQCIEINANLFNQTHKYPKTRPELTKSRPFFADKPVFSENLQTRKRRILFSSDDELEVNSVEPGEGVISKPFGQ